MGEALLRWVKRRSVFFFHRENTAQMVPKILRKGFFLTYCILSS
jgi:hypothetical protein